MILLFNQDQARGTIMQALGEMEIVLGNLMKDNKAIEKGKALYEEGYDLKALGDMQAAIEKEVGEKIY